MDIVETEVPCIVEAKSSGCKNKKRNISYSFIESAHSLCFDRKEIILAQIQACERLLNFAKDETDLITIKTEISFWKYFNIRKISDLQNQHRGNPIISTNNNKKKAKKDKSKTKISLRQNKKRNIYRGMIIDFSRIFSNKDHREFIPITKLLLQIKESIIKAICIIGWGMIETIKIFMIVSHGTRHIIFLLF